MAKVRERKTKTTSRSDSPPEYLPRVKTEETGTRKKKPRAFKPKLPSQVEGIIGKIDKLQKTLDQDMEVIERRVARRAKETGEEIETTIDRASKQEYWGCRVRFKANVVAKAISPYLVPRRVKIICGKGGKGCYGCLVIANNVVEIDLMNEDAIALIDSTKGATRQLISEVGHIPSTCHSWSSEVEEKANVQDIYVSGAFSSIITTEEIDAVRRVLYIGHDITANSIYKMHGKVASNPKTNEVVYLVDSIVAERDDILDVEVSKEMKAAAEFFSPAKPYDRRSIRHRLDEIYDDLADNVTNIYGRQALHTLIDLGFHSVLAWRWEGDPPDKLYKGTTELLIVGDSGQGKSEAMMRLRDHYGRDERIDCKSASYAGLVGGIDDFGGRRFMVWGRIPQNDRGLVILDEVKGMPTELVAQLTDVRSSQMAIVTRIGGTRRASARVRYFWISNPRGRLRVQEFGHGVTAILDLLGSPEDVRRLDAAMILSSGEVPQDYIDDKITADAPVEHTHTSDRCRELLKLTWSRVGTIISTPVKKYIVKRASELALKYSPQIPLLEPADARYKLARLSISLAARLGSFTEDWSGVDVRECHVDSVCDYIQEIYDAPNFAFDRWSKSQKRETEVEDTEQDIVIRIIRDLPNPTIFVDAVAGSEWIGFPVMKAAVGGDRDRAEKVIEEFLNLHYFTRYRKSYRKTPKLISLIREIKDLGLLAPLPQVLPFIRKEEDDDIF